MITVEQIQKTDTFSKMEKIRQTFAIKRDNRQMINDAVIICRNIGFDQWRESSSFTSWNISIVEEILNQ